MQDNNIEGKGLAILSINYINIIVVRLIILVGIVALIVVALASFSVSICYVG